jgi:SAM-dependent methyltransferase
MSLLGTLEVNQHLDIDAFLTASKNSRVYWSPYQELAVTPTYLGREVISYLVTANGSQHQWIFNFSSAFVHSHPKLFADAPADWNHYNLPYRFFPHPASVLVLGAGTGNDAAAALRNGAGRLVAVEIEPLIVNLGRRLHFEQPYSSPRVHVIVDDARSYMQNRHDPFDLIMFSFLDSKTNSSYYSNIRIDNYVYTVEAFQAAKRLLKPDGLMIIKFYARMPWIAGRLEQLAHTAFGQPPLQLNTVPFGGRIFVCGSRAKLAQALRDPRAAAYVASHSNVPMEQAPITTDDWPYFYQHEPGLPASWIIISIVLITLCLYFLRETGTPPGSLRWHFFFLGAGFMLLETQIVSKMALLFGTTWMVNSVVIAGLLILIVASNFLVEWKPRIAYGAAYAGIFASIALAYFVPLETFFFPSIWMKALTASAVLCLPVFFAGIVFIRSFARDGFRSEALGSNLMGALIGGLLESLSMWTGMRSLLGGRVRARPAGRGVG